MQKIKKHAPEFFCKKFWVLALIFVSGFILIPIHAKNFFHGQNAQAVTIESSIQEEDHSGCSWKVSRSGYLHGPESPYYGRVNFKTDLCLEEALSVVDLLR